MFKSEHIKPIIDLATVHAEALSAAKDPEQFLDMLEETSLEFEVLLETLGIQEDAECHADELYIQTQRIVTTLLGLPEARPSLFGLQPIASYSLN